MNESGNSHEALLFYQDDEICKEMTFAEFEAVLDGVVGMSDFANASLQAVFVLISPQLKIKGATFFTIEFDESGYADPRWNLPLRTIAERADMGPDLGGGAFRIGCKSSCYDPVLADSLWNPSQHHVVELINRIQENRLCLPVDQAALASVDVSNMAAAVPIGWQANPVHRPTSAMPEPHYNASANDAGQQQVQLASLIREQRTQLESLASQSQHQLHKANLAFEKDLTLANMQLERLRAEHEKLQSQSIEIAQALNEERQARKQEMQEHERFKQAQLAELEQQVDQRTESLNKEAQSLRLKLKLRDDEVNQMREELMQLRKDKLRLTQEGGGKFLERLENLGINFIAYHPGAGHLSIALNDMTDYMENPIVFAARKCKVTEDQYKIWLQHYQQPECSAPITNEKRCACRIPRVDNPANFVVGKSDRCDKHKVHKTDTNTANIGG